MLKTVRASAIILAILIALPIAGIAGDDDHPKKYGVEFMLGGGYYSLTDLNDYVPVPELVGVTPTEIHIGTQLGIGLIYRQQDNFGWQFGYNRLFAGIPIAMVQKFEIETILPNSSGVTLVEQEVSGSELYVMATWYKGWGQSKELQFGIGPALYKASLDRSNILYNPTVNASGFTNAKGKAFGLIAVIGLELPVGETTGLSIQIGARSAEVGRVSYDDPTDTDPENVTIVPLNSYSNSDLPIDFSGAFGKITLRTYFEPTSNWRTPQR